MTETHEHSEKKRGRQAGQTKRMSVISDPLIAPWEIHISERAFEVIDTSANQAQNFEGSFTSASRALACISHLQLVNKKITLNLKEYLTELRKTEEKLKKVLE